MARLGTEKRPLRARAQTLDRANEIAALCEEHGGKFVMGIEPDKPEDVSDIEKLQRSQFVLRSDEQECSMAWDAGF